MTEQSIIEEPVEHKGRQGFLPIQTNTFDRYFISVVIFVALHLLYMRFIEPVGAPLWIATIICILIGYAVVTRG